jgi:hypothetical protein
MAKGHEAVPDILYHYTSIEAFQSIIESKKMRATRYDQMNDTGELQLGVHNLREAITGHPVGDSLADVKDFKDFLISEIEDYGKDTLDVYVLSLSAAADSLDQWRAYSPNGGVAIGFDYRKVQKGFLIDITPKVGGRLVANPIRHDFANRLMRCQYTDKDGHLDRKALVAIADSFFKENSFLAGCASPKALVRDISCLALSVKIYRTVCSIKHGAYSS